jgi:DNA-binding NarL/FixJ family response regulator
MLDVIGCKGRIDRVCAAGLYHLSMGTPIRLLIADDSATIRRTICSLLQAQTDIAVCGEAGNYAELLKIFNATTTDAVLMDVRMPGGKLFTPATIKAHFNGSCLLVMSVWNDAETASLARSFGAAMLLDKGQLASTLISAVKECVDKNGKAPR